VIGRSRAFNERIALTVADLAACMSKLASFTSDLNGGVIVAFPTGNRLRAPDLAGAFLVADFFLTAITKFHIQVTNIWPVVQNFNDNAIAVNYQCTFNPLEKFIEQVEKTEKLYEVLLKSETEKNELLQSMLKK
jgi:hypothetical protein